MASDRPGTRRHSTPPRALRPRPEPPVGRGGGGGRGAAVFPRAYIKCTVDAVFIYEYFAYFVPRVRAEFILVPSADSFLSRGERAGTRI